MSTEPINAPFPAMTASSFGYLQKVFDLRWRDVRYIKHKLNLHCNLQNNKAPSLQNLLKKTEAHKRLKSVGTGDAAHQGHYSLGHSNARVPYQSSVKVTTAAQQHSGLSARCTNAPLPPPLLCQHSTSNSSHNRNFK